MENWNGLHDFPSAPASLQIATPLRWSSCFEPSSLFRRKWNPRTMKCQGLVVIAGGLPGDPELEFGSDGLLLIGVVFFPSSSLMGVMLFPSYVR